MNTSGKNPGRKKRKILSLFLYAVLFCVLLVISAGIAVIWKYHRTISSGEKVTVTKTILIPENITLGKKFSLKFSCRVPWGTKEDLLEFVSVPQNMQVTSPPFFRTVKYAWGYNILEGELPLQAFADGKSSGGVYAFSFRNAKTGEVERKEEKIPEITVLPAEVNSSDLQTAEKILEKSVSVIPYIAAGLILILVIGTLIFFLLRRKKSSSGKKAPPVWELTFLAISDLLTRVHAGKVRTEQSVAELTDIIRFYMEKRFSIPAEHQTSDEFFHALHKKQNLLTSSQQDFLRKFLYSADLVKFANISADVSLVEDAALQAENLVRETIPVPENGTGKDAVKHTDSKERKNK